MTGGVAMNSVANGKITQPNTVSGMSTFRPARPTTAPPLGQRFMFGIICWTNRAALSKTTPIWECEVRSDECAEAITEAGLPFRTL